MTGNAVMARKGSGNSYRWLSDHARYSDDNCLTWPFGGANGYGTFSFNGKMHYAHRFMCEMVHGPAPGRNYHASHSCGRGHLGCVNPRHLSWKTVSENQLDRAEHGTRNMGPYGKLTDAQAAEIRALKGSMPQREIAAMYGVSRSTISWVMTGKTWTTDRKYRRLSPDANARLLSEIDKPLGFLAEKYGLARSAIYRRRKAVSIRGI
jgi:predicted XRE-type DNA-binding protein